jgi:hypothetical protein
VLVDVDWPALAARLRVSGTRIVADFARVPLDTIEEDFARVPLDTNEELVAPFMLDGAP